MRVFCSNTFSSKELIEFEKEVESLIDIENTSSAPKVIKSIKYAIKRNGFSNTEEILEYSSLAQNKKFYN